MRYLLAVAAVSILAGGAFAQTQEGGSAPVARAHSVRHSHMHMHRP
jgi:hypothetical protein